MSTKNDSDELVWRKVEPSSQPAPLMVAGTNRRLSEDAKEWHVEPPAGPMSVTLTPATEKDAQIVVSRAETLGAPITVFGAGDPVILDPGSAVTFQAAPATKPRLRVFRFRGDAWQCPKDSVSCWLRLTDGRNPAIIVQGHEGREADQGDSVQVIALACNVEATRLSTWSEWFELTLRRAAHDYLDLSLDMGRLYGRAGNDPAKLIRASFAYACAKGALDDIIATQESQTRDMCCFGADAYESLYNYMFRVKADIELRLSGEPGSVVHPDSEGE